MLPVLLNLAPLKIYTFGAFLVLAFFWGTFFIWKLVRLTSYKEEDIFDGFFLSLLGAIVGGRLIYVLLNFADFGFDILKIILINGYPGLSLYGSFMGGFLGLYFYLALKKISFRDAIDYFCPSLFLSLALGKLGAFFSGVEVGTKTKFFLAVRYSGYDGLRHLTPLYESLFFVVGAYLGYRLLFEIRKEKYPRGFSFYFFLWFVGLTYLLFDKITESRLYLQGANFNFIVSVILFLTGSFYFLYYFRHRLKAQFKNVIHFSSHHGKKINKGTHQETPEKIRVRGKKPEGPSQ